MGIQSPTVGLGNAATFFHCLNLLDPWSPSSQDRIGSRTPLSLFFLFWLCKSSAVCHRAEGLWVQQEDCCFLTWGSRHSSPGKEAVHVNNWVCFKQSLKSRLVFIPCLHGNVNGIGLLLARPLRGLNPSRSGGDSTCVFLLAHLIFLVWSHQ